MKEQDQSHTEALAEIQLILNNLLETEYFEHLKKQVNQEIEDQIDQLVKEQVAIGLDSHIPQNLQDEVIQQKVELENLQMQLHNSESRRANACVKADEGAGTLHTIYMTNGQVSRHFPKTLEDLFNLDAETCKEMMRDYGLTDITDAQDRNLNYFMQFCGVTYRIVSVKLLAAHAQGLSIRHFMIWQVRTQILHF
ncbi:hypothetical protein BDZ94DRAFT_1169090 [Collybia nuda]|uniref:Uncharacterized protein n=1 Tax=Collybia nuda TaxID=64659 RepID=A0A9P6CHB6_9AGAR|nr:hypothetical protein BDZ94DRAFT_1169090 [Collybia nuda]